MASLNHIAYVTDATADASEFLGRLSSEGFSCTLVRPDQPLLGRHPDSRPSVILLSAEIAAAERRRILQELKERFSYIPVLLTAANGCLEFLKPEMHLPYDGVCCTAMAPASAALLLRGVIRTSFTVRELVQSNRKLNEISITDALTGLYNRGYMVDRLNLEFKRAARNRETLSCLMIDLDHFKNINDTYGHKFGDFVLQAISARLKSLIRETDIFGRYGGEEFLIVLPNTNLEGGRRLGEKLRAGLENETIQHEDFSLLVTASFGVASTENTEVVTADHLLQLSDRTLYQAKETGRNRVCVSGVG
jgi:two-component system, cell cycle response regulator